ncbi:MAG: hypothetical protein KY464_04245, partial [Gemmatimonadetes bacterium]|nr:hypothetical protein [Gemmatimonadota bacterium]
PVARDAESSVARAALLALSGAGAGGDLSPFLDALASADPARHLAALEGLASRRAPEAVAPIAVMAGAAADDEVRDAAIHIMEILQNARTMEHRRVQEMVQEILDTFYTWPLMLPQELVYFFRATALLEGIGLRYDPAFNGLDAVKPVVGRMSGEILAGSMKAPSAIARDVLGQAEHTIRALYDLVNRAEREELRFRAHPRDVLQHERFLGLMVRRLLLGIFAAVMALVATLIFVATGSYFILVSGNLVALFLFLLVLVIPKHLLESPLRRAREARRTPPSPRR